MWTRLRVRLVVVAAAFGVGLARDVLAFLGGMIGLDRRVNKTSC